MTFSINHKKRLILNNCEIKRCNLLIIEQDCKIVDWHTAGIELLSLNKENYMFYLSGEKIHTHFNTAIDYLDLDIKEKVNSNELPLISFERFFTDDQSKSDRSSTLIHELPKSNRHMIKNDIGYFSPKSEKTTENEQISCFHKVNIKEVKNEENNENKQKFEEPKIEVWNEKFIKLVFLVHGLDGKSDNMLNLRSFLRVHHPDTIFYASISNEELTNEPISILGERLAKEIKSYITDNFSESSLRISFIGHSMGGLIIKAALPHLSEYSHFFWTYMSICSPHLGCGSSNFLVNAGMGFLKKLKGSDSLREISLGDDDRFLSKLGDCSEMGWFKNIIMACNYEDGYVKHPSAKILHKHDSSDLETTSEITRNFYKRIKAKNICKIGVLMPNSSKGLDRFIGKQPHMELLENQFLARLVFEHLHVYFL